MKILYEDNHIIVAYKPKGILSQADGSDVPDMLQILKDYIKEKYQKPGAVYLGLLHRLDRNTSGVMVFARTSKSASRLSEDIRNHRFEKKYLAVVEGSIEGTGLIELHHYLKKDEQKKKSFESKTGQEAILTYRVLGSKKMGDQSLSYVDITLKTGRFHQIRCQFSLIGHPLLGDKKYGSKLELSPEDFPLEAYHLGFFHPTTKEWMSFEWKEKNKWFDE